MSATILASRQVPGGAASLSSATVAFTDGDTVKRVTISDALVTATSKIALTVGRPNVADIADKGFFYVANIVSRTTGSFDVAVMCIDDPVGSPPNETITLYYLLG